MKNLILLRHGQSLWNLRNLFTGWTDVELSDKGREEAAEAGRLIKGSGIEPQYCFTSYLRRAIHTLDIALDEMDRCYLPVVKDWHLNERHYGALQGLNKTDTAMKYGEEQVHIWRRSYDVQPPAIEPGDDRSPLLDPRYKGLSAEEVPFTESLRDTIQRVRPCWEEKIVPALGLYDNVMVVAHGNSLRGLLMMLLHMTPEAVTRLEIPTGKPRVLTLDDRLKVTGDRYL